MSNISYWLGLLVVLAALLILLLVSRKNRSQTYYDEMQERIRGKAYKYSALTGVIVGIFTGVFWDENILPMDGGFALTALGMLMVTVYAIYMIRKGVYFGIEGKWKPFTALILVVGGINLALGISNIAKDGLINGRLTTENEGLIMGILFLLIGAAVLIQKFTAGKENAE